MKLEKINYYSRRLPQRTQMETEQNKSNKRRFEKDNKTFKIDKNEEKENLYTRI